MDRLEDLGVCVNAAQAPQLARQVAIIGGGYAGIAAAVKLAELGVISTVFEAGKSLGGRARRIEYRGHNLDNGQHILSGAYSELLRMMALVKVPDNAYRRVPLTLMFGMPPEFLMRAPYLPKPLHMAIALLTARGLNWRERFAAIRLMQALKACKFKLDTNLTVADLLKMHHQPPKLTQYLWQPLTISALNTPLETASAQVFANVLRDALGGSRAASDLILPKVDLSALFPEPAAVWLTAHGSQVRLGERVSAIEKNSAGFVVSYGPFKEAFSQVIIAIAPHQLTALQSRDSGIQQLMSASTDHFAYEPITTIYLAFPPSSRSLSAPMLGRTSGTVQWFFDRNALIGGPGLNIDLNPDLHSDLHPALHIYAGVVSASGPHEHWPLDELAAVALRELREWLPDLAEPLWHKVIHEKRATFACTPGLRRPSTQTAVPGLTLAGDYVACDYPATLEAAVRNGCRAAEMTFQQL